jgi:hypothetical protein
MSIVGAFDVHRRQLTFEYLDTREAPPLTAEVDSSACAGVRTGSS